MRSVYIACPLLQGPGGIAAYTRSLLEAWHAIPLDALGQGRDPKLFKLPSNVRVLNSHSSQAGFAARLAYDWMTRAPTVFVFAHVGLLKPLVFLPYRPQHRVVLLAHGIEMWNALTPWKARAARRVDSLVCTTRYTLEAFRSNNPHVLSDKALTPIIPLSGLREWEALPLASVPTGKKKIALVISRLTLDEPLKGIPMLIRAAKLLHAEQWEIRVVGAGEGLSYFKNLAEKNDVSDRLHFLGWKSDEEKQKEIEACDVLCLPSAQEGFGIVFLEAMVLGKPCVGASAGAAPEVLPSGLSALHAFDDEKGFVEAIELMAGKMRSGMMTAELIRKAYLERFSWAHFSNEWNAHLDTLRTA